MTEIDPRLEGQLETWFADARAAMERQLDGAGRGMDFVDVMDRLRVVDPDRVTSRALAEFESRRIPPVHGDPRAPLDAELDDWIGDTREVVERMVEDIREHRPRAADVRRRWGALLGVAAAAAVLIAAASSPSRMAHRADGETSAGVQAIDQRVGARAGRMYRTGRRQVASTGMAVRIEGVKLTRSEEPTVLVPEARAELDTNPGPSPADLERMLEEAQVHWRADERAAATRLLRRIVRVGGRSKVVELAYSDLFALEHRSEPSRRVSLWRGYLRRFPHGRFADDAKAGVCRLSTDRGCWAHYLEGFPQGSYRQEARLALEARTAPEDP